MRLLSTILPLVGITTAFVLPDQQVMDNIAIETQPQPSLDKLKGSLEEAWSTVDDTFEGIVTAGENALDYAMNTASAKFECYHSMMAFDTQGWLDSGAEAVEDLDIDDNYDHPHKKPHKKPKHPKHPHHEPNQTVYQLIAGSKYTTKFTKLINEYPDLVDLLNGTVANYTVFAPTDKAFEKIPKHDKVSKELIQKVLAYHISALQYSALNVLYARTIPTTLNEDALGGHPQRIRVGVGLGGLRLNFYSRVIAFNIFGTNGVIHGIDSILLPPPPAAKILELLPGEFSTLQLALVKTGLDDVIAEGPHAGGTLFAPSNSAFRKLGPKINAFLFSKYGEKYLSALLKYHIVANQTLYSDAFFRTDSESENTEDITSIGTSERKFHVDLPTLLEDKSLSIDITRWGRIITIKINAFNSVAVPDGIAKDGVIHVLSNILIPPKTPGEAEWKGEEMSVDEFKDRFDTYYGEL